MDQGTIMFLSRILLASLYVVPAVITALLGYRLYKNGAGFGRDHLQLKWKDFEAHAGSVGSVIMLTACVWVVPAALAIPSYENGPIHISNSVYDFKAPLMEIRPTASLASVMSDPDALQGYLSKAIAEANASPDRTLELNGQPAHYVADSISVNAVGNGTYFLKAGVKAVGSLGEVSFAVEAHDNKITFRPWHVSGLVSPNGDPNSVRLPDGNGGSSSSTPEPLPLPDRDQESNSTKPAPLPMPGENGESNTPKPLPLPSGQ